jgi:hypothetical protein
MRTLDDRSHPNYMADAGLISKNTYFIDENHEGFTPQKRGYFMVFFFVVDEYERGDGFAVISNR